MSRTSEPFATWRPAWVAGAPSLEDRDVRLARLVVAAFGLGGPAGHRHHPKSSAGRVRPHGPDSRRRLQAARRPERPDPDRFRLGRDCIRCGDRGRRRPRFRGDAVEHVGRRAPPATPARSRRTVAPRSSSSTSVAPRTTAPKVGPVLDRVAAAQRRIRGLRSASSATPARQGGRDAYATTSARPGTLSLPITLIILVIAFGASWPRASRCCSP